MGMPMSSGLNLIIYPTPRFQKVRAFLWLKSSVVGFVRSTLVTLSFLLRLPKIFLIVSSFQFAILSTTQNRKIPFQGNCSIFSLLTFLPKLNNFYRDLNDIAKWNYLVW